MKDHQIINDDWFDAIFDNENSFSVSLALFFVSVGSTLEFVQGWFPVLYVLLTVGKINSEAFANTLMPACDFLMCVGGCLLHGLMVRIKGVQQSPHPLRCHSGISVLCIQARTS